MASLIQINYGVDSNGNVLSLSVNPSTVGSYKTTSNSFCIYLNGINYLGSSPVPSSSNFQTKIEFLSPTGSTGSTGAGNFMEFQWNNSVYNQDFLSTLGFQNSGFIFSQTILTS